MVTFGDFPRVSLTSHEAFSLFLSRSGLADQPVQARHLKDTSFVDFSDRHPRVGHDGSLLAGLL